MQKHDKKCEKCNNDEMREIIILNSKNTRFSKKDSKNENG
jgi:hypothetical protein